MKAFRNAAGPLMLSVTLLGCGGGGSGDEEPPPVSLAELRQRPLALTTEQVPAVMALSLSSADLTVSLADWATAMIKEAARKLPDGSTKACTNSQSSPSTSLMRWVDTNNDGKLNEGDKLTAEFAQCWIPELTSYVTGRLEVRISQLTDARRGSAVGEISFPQLMLFPDASSGSVSAGLAGSLKFSNIVDDFQVRTDVSPSALDDLRIPIAVTDSKTGLVTSINEYIKLPNLTRLVQYDLAKTTMSGSLQVQSEALKGRFDFRFGEGLSAYLLQFPHEGRAEVVGDKGKISITPGAKGAERYFNVKMDSAGDGQYEYSSSADWLNYGLGRLWTDGYSALTNLGDLQEFGGRFDILAEGEPVAWENKKSLMVQFRQELAPGQTLKFRLRQVIEGEAWYMPKTYVDIPANITTKGARTIIRPLVNIEYGGNFELELSQNGLFDLGQPVEVPLRTGQVSYFANGKWDIGTPGDIGLSTWPNTPPNPSLLEGGAGFRVSLTPGVAEMIRSVQWTQISGPRVRFESPNNLITRISLTDTVPGGKAPVLVEVKAIAIDGRESIKKISLMAYGDAALQKGLVHYLDSEEGGVVGQGQAQLILPRPNVTSAYVSDNLVGVGAEYVSIANEETTTSTVAMDSSIGFWLNSGRPLETRLYSTSEVDEETQSVPGVDVNDRGANCNSGSLQGTFRVLEIAPVVGSTPARFAVDYDLRCSSNGSTLRGSVRLNSGIPLRR